ncbi:MAG: Replication factor A [Methanoregula sp. PtaU1.Bin051]|nr:MAG: Replication factor A [Methanoregula sp. PtaU1.Bin051]
MSLLFHYALVDDLISREEFERRVEAKIDECGDLVDEPTAAMMVVSELGRAHVRIRDLSGKSSLFSFFGKVLDKTDPKVFDRTDGEKGAVATLLLGDATGSVRVVLWDERVGAVEEISPGEVLEVIGRPPAKGRREIYALALRKASCRIECEVPPGTATSLKDEPVDLDVLVLSKGPPRTYTRRDGTTGELAEALIGDASGTARLVAWVPELLSGVVPGETIHITGAKPNTRGEGRAYSIDEKSAVTPADTSVSVPFTPPASVADQGIYSVRGTVKYLREPRSFTTRSGKSSWVRNIQITDGNEDLKVVLWGDHALLSLSPGILVEIYHGTAKPGRSADIELHAGRDCCIRVPGERGRSVVFEGTIIPNQGGVFIDNGKERYLIDGGNLPLWQDVQVTGTVSGGRIRPEHWEPAGISLESVQRELKNVKKLLGSL